MRDRPEVIVKFATSFDGCFDDTSPQRVRFSGEDDIAAVDALRAECDAILVGAETLRRDNPRLLLRSEAFRQQRREAGKSPDPLRVCLTGSGMLPADSVFFRSGEGARLVYTNPQASDALTRALEGKAEVVVLRHAEAPLAELLADLHQRGVRKLLLEGGPNLIGQFLRADLVDTFRIAVSSRIIGERSAPRLFAAASANAKRCPRITRVEAYSELVVMSGSYLPAG